MLQGCRHYDIMQKALHDTKKGYIVCCHNVIILTLTLIYKKSTFFMGVVEQAADLKMIPSAVQSPCLKK